MAMGVVYIPSETSFKVSAGLSHQGLIETQICNKNTSSVVDRPSQWLSKVDRRCTGSHDDGIIEACAADILPNRRRHRYDESAMPANVLLHPLHYHPN